MKSPPPIPSVGPIIRWIRLPNSVPLVGVPPANSGLKQTRVSRRPATMVRGSLLEKVGIIITSYQKSLDDHILIEPEIRVIKNGGLSQKEKPANYFASQLVEV
jgi:hypothetical protein